MIEEFRYTTGSACEDEITPVLKLPWQVPMMMMISLLYSSCLTSSDDDDDDITPSL